MNKRDAAILAWARENTPQHAEGVEEILQNGLDDMRMQALYVLFCIAFDAGRQFQSENPNMELNNPGLY